MGSKKTVHSQVTMRDVAEMAGVSRMAVSRALKPGSSISAEKRAHILKIVKEMNYVPDLMAGSLTTKKSGFVALLLPSLNNLHFAQTVQALTEEFEPAGLQLLLGHTDYSPQREEQLVEVMLRRRPEAIILSYDGHTDRTIELLHDAHIPVVEIWEKPDDPIQHTVGFSNEDAAGEMTNALIDAGFRRIVFLGEEKDDWTRGAARRKGFARTMQAAGLDATSELRFGTPPLSIENGAAAADQILQLYPDVECIFCVSDMAAYGVQSRLKQLGKSVPGDVSVVGFGNFEVSRFSSPAISTVVVDAQAIGRESGRLIVQLLADEDREQGADDLRSESSLQVNIPTSLDFRESSKRLSSQTISTL